jgi:hypothetical protein
VAYGNPEALDNGNLHHGETYYVIRTGDNSLQLAASREDAQDGIALSIVGGGDADLEQQLQFGSGPATGGPDGQAEQGKAMQSAAADITSVQAGHAGRADAALASKATAGTTAYIGDGAVVTAGEDTVHFLIAIHI